MRDTTPNPHRPHRSFRRRTIFIAAAMLIGTVPLILLEAGLRLVGAGGEVTYEDPLVGFSRVAPLFELDESAGIFATARSRQVLFERQQFVAEKPANGRRIFCLGGSTVRGRPYTTETAFARWVQLELAARDPQHVYEVVNCGGLSYASYRLTHILQEVLDYDPDLIVIATGHNEFLEDRTYAALKMRSPVRSWIEDRLHRLRVFRVVREWARGAEQVEAASADERPVLPELVEPMLDQASGYASYHRDDAWAADVRTHFDMSVRTMVEMCRTRQVPVMLVLPGANVRDCPPFKSEHRPDLNLQQERDWQRHLDAAESSEERDPEAALAEYRAAAAIDEEYALLRFRIASVLDRLGRTGEAAAHYLAAREYDVCPLRMRESFASALWRIAEDTHTPLVDACGLLESESRGRLPGNDWYMDHVHPSIGAHQRIGAAIVGALDEVGLDWQLASWSAEERRRADQAHLKSLGPRYLSDGFERVSWLEKWARRQRLLEETLPRDPFANVRYGHRLWDFGRRDAAWHHYREAVAANPQTATAVLDRCDELFEQGRADDAIHLLERLAGLDAASVAPEIAERRSHYQQ